MATEEHSEAPQPLTELPFAPLTKSHIIHCSYHNWYPKYDLPAHLIYQAIPTNTLLDIVLYLPKLASSLSLALSLTTYAQTAL
jgi:hypothetical protein